MKTIKKLLIPAALLVLSLVFYSCEKLPLKKNFKYNTALYDNQVDMTVMEFMYSRQDLFSGLIRALNYMDEFPEHRHIRSLYEQSGNTFLLLTNNALTNPDVATSWFAMHPVLDTDPESLTYNRMVPGTVWEQYDKDEVAELLKYHVLKGMHNYTNINATPKWVDTYALSATNDSAKVYIYLSNDREGRLLINNYIATPPSPTLSVVPRTPDLHAKNGVMQVVDRYFMQPTKEAIRTNNQQLPGED